MVHGRTLACGFGVDAFLNPVVSYVVQGFPATCRFLWGFGNAIPAVVNLPDLLIEEVITGGKGPSFWYFKILDGEAAKKGILKGWDLNIGNTDLLGKVCWGTNRRPTNFRDALTVFFNSPFQPSASMIPYNFTQNPTVEAFQAKITKSAKRYFASCLKKKPLEGFGTYQIVNGKIDAVALLAQRDLAKYRLSPASPTGDYHLFPCIRSTKTRYDIVTPLRKVRF
jgi:hypothetical protein